MNFPRATSSAALPSTFAGESCKDQHQSYLLLPQEWKSRSERGFFFGRFHSFSAVWKGRKVESSFSLLDIWNPGCKRISLVWCSNGFRTAKVQAEASGMISQGPYSDWMHQAVRSGCWERKFQCSAPCSCHHPYSRHCRFGDTSVDQKLLQILWGSASSFPISDQWALLSKSPFHYSHLLTGVVLLPVASATCDMLGGRNNADKVADTAEDPKIIKPRSADADGECGINLRGKTAYWSPALSRTAPGSTKKAWKPTNGHEYILNKVYFPCTLVICSIVHGRTKTLGI